MDTVPVLEEEATLELSLWTMWGHSKKSTLFKPGRKLSLEPVHANTLILDFQLPDCEKINFCCLATQSMVFCHGIPQARWYNGQMISTRGQRWVNEGKDILFQQIVLRKLDIHKKLKLDPYLIQKLPQNGSKNKTSELNYKTLRMKKRSNISWHYLAMIS